MNEHHAMISIIIVVVIVNYVTDSAVSHLPPLGLVLSLTVTYRTQLKEICIAPKVHSIPVGIRC